MRAAGWTELHYPHLINHGKKMTTAFDNTYACEQLFSSMKITKSKLRAQLTDGHVQEVMLLDTSNLLSELQKLKRNTTSKMTFVLL